MLYRSYKLHRRTLSLFVLGLVITSLCYHGTGNETARMVDRTMARIVLLLTLPLVDPISALLFALLIWIHTSPITHKDGLYHVDLHNLLMGTEVKLKTQYHVLMHCVAALCLVHCSMT